MKPASQSTWIPSHSSQATKPDTWTGPIVATAWSEAVAIVDAGHIHVRPGEQAAKVTADDHDAMLGHAPHAQVRGQSLARSLPRQLHDGVGEYARGRLPNDGFEVLRYAAQDDGE